MASPAPDPDPGADSAETLPSPFGDPSAAVPTDTIQDAQVVGQDSAVQTQLLVTEERGRRERPSIQKKAKAKKPSTFEVCTNCKQTRVFKKYGGLCRSCTAEASADGAMAEEASDPERGACSTQKPSAPTGAALSAPIETVKLPVQAAAPAHARVSFPLDSEVYPEAAAVPRRSAQGAKSEKRDAGDPNNKDASKQAGPNEGKSDQAASIRHGKFITDGRVQEYVYVLSNGIDVGVRSPELFEMILRHWNVSRPHLLIKFQSGFAHPYNLIDAKELKKMQKLEPGSELCHHFDQFKSFVQDHDDTRSDDEDADEDVAGDGESVSTSSSEDRVTRKARKHLNQFLYKSLSGLIDVIVRAAVRNRCWILVEGGPNGGLVLLKQAAERCKERPVILVIDSFNKKRYAYRTISKDFKEQKKARKEGRPDAWNLAEVSLKDLFLQDTALSRKLLHEHLEKLVSNWNPNSQSSLQKSSASVTSTKSPDGKKNSSGRPWTAIDEWELQELHFLTAGMTDALISHSKPIDQPNPEPVRLGLDFWTHQKSLPCPEKFGTPAKGKKLYTDEKGWPFQTSKDKHSKKIRWNAWHFRGGTHYIFLEDSKQELMTNCLAPSGCIFLGGGEGSKQELMTMLQNGEPVVCLNNTGRLTQDFVVCHNYLCRTLFKIQKASDDFESKGGKGVQGSRNKKKLQEHPSAMRESDQSSEKHEVSSFLRQKRGFRERASTGETFRTQTSEDLESVAEHKVHDPFQARTGMTARSTVFKMSLSETHQGVAERVAAFEGLGTELSEVREFTRPELSELLMTYLRRGLQITKLCVVMDPLNPRECSGGRTEDKLSKCLSNFVILASNDTSDFADVEAVKAASLLKEQLQATAGAEHSSAAFATYSLLFLNFLSLVVALARNSTAPFYMTWLPESMKRWGLPALSALSTFLAGLMARFRFTLRWSKARSAAAQLEAEIWKFRTRVGDYMVIGASQTGDTEDPSQQSSRYEAQGHAVTRERKQDETRAFFRSNVNSIFNSAMEEMGTSSIHNGGHDKLRSTRGLRWACFERCWRLWCCKRCHASLEEEEEEPQTPVHTPDKGGPENIDLSEYGHIGIDDYYQDRTLKILDKMKFEAFTLTVAQGWLEGMVLMFGTLGVLLSTFDQTELAMLCVSLGANLQTIEKFHALSNRLDAANTGERDMICAWQDWSAMEPMQRRFQSNVTRLVMTTEGVNVALISAATAGVRQTLAKKAA